MLALQPCLPSRHLGRRMSQQPQAVPEQATNTSSSSRCPPFAAEVCLIWCVGCTRPYSCKASGSRVCRVRIRSQDPETHGAEEEAAEDRTDEDTKEKLLSRLRKEVSSSHPVAARILLSASSDLQQEMLEVMAQETMAHPVENFRWLLRALRKADVAPDSVVQLYTLVQPWFSEQKPNREQWAQVVYALARSGRLDEASQIVQDMEMGFRDLPKPDARMYTVLVREMAKQQGPSLPAALLSRMKVQGILEDFQYLLLMVVAYAKYSSSPDQLDRAKLYVRKAEEYLRRQRYNFRMELQEPLFLYTALMSGYTRLGRFRDAFSILGVLRQRCIQPNAVTFYILQRCCLPRLDAAGDVRQLLRIMEQMGVAPETGNYNYLIESYGGTGQMTLALDVANRMREAGVPWDKNTYLNLIRAVSSAGQVQLAVRLLTRMRRDGVRPGAAHYKCTFVSLARAGYYEDAARVFQRLVAIGAESQYAYNMMMGIECRRGDINAALDVMEQMKEAGWPPDIMSYRILVEGSVASADWPGALALYDDILDLRRRLTRISKESRATEAAKAAAEQQLNLTISWTKVYHLLVDAAVYNAEWPRAVALIEELLELGLPVSYSKHARLLQDVNTYARQLAYYSSLQGEGRPLSPDWSAMTETEKVRLRSQRRWSSQVPNVHKGSGIAAQLKVGEGQLQEPALALPPYVFSASFYPSWMDGGEGHMEEHEELKLWESSQKQIQSSVKESAKSTVSAQRGHKILYLYHHATVHRRPLVSVSLPPSRPLIGRMQPESLETLRQLFETTGWPGQSGAVYVFMRPGSANLDAFLAMLAAAAAHPEDVLLLRSEDPGDAANLAAECRERRCRAIGFSLALTLKRLPAALLVNRRCLVTNSCDVIKTTCRDFEESFRRALVHEPVPGETQVVPEIEADEDDEETQEGRGDAASVWNLWLRRNRLHQMIRYDGNNLRLDGVMHRPALSKGESFRARAQKGGEVSVDLALPELSDEDGPGSFLAWF